VSEIIGCPDCNPFDALINSVSQITGVVKRCGALILEMTNSVQIFHLGCQTRMKINVDVFVGRLQFIIQPIKLIVDHLYGLKHLSCPPNFPRASYLDERTLTHESIVK